MTSIKSGVLRAHRDGDCHEVRVWDNAQGVNEMHRYARRGGKQAGWLLELIAQLQVRYPSVPIVFADSRKLAEEWTYRFLAAALSQQVGLEAG